MHLEFDVTLKRLMEDYPTDWSVRLLAHLGLRAGGSVSVIDADLSTVSAEADKVFRVAGRPPYILHLELQASRDVGLPGRGLRYNVLLNERHGLPVRSVVVLLRPRADGPELTGTEVRRLAPEEPYLTFHYRVVRLWQMPAEPFLAGGLGTLPLAPLCNVPRQEVADVVRRLNERLEREAKPGEAAVLRTAAFVLMGLRYRRDFTEQIFRGIGAVRESTTYMGIIEEGRVEEARKFLLLLGRIRFGPPDESMTATINGLTDLDYLELLGERLLTVSSWEELLAPPRPARARRRRRSSR